MTRRRRPRADDAATTSIFVTPGTLLAERYLLGDELGRGAAGVVFAATDTLLDDSEVAIKVLPPEVARDPRARKRLRKEVMTSNRLSHENILRVHVYEEDGDHAFLVMERLSGPNLLEALFDTEDELLPLDQVLRIAADVCPALDFAHDRGVVHRDIKPANLMYDDESGEPRVKVTDFGIAARVRDTMTRLTGVEPSGTLSYVAPEILRGKEAGPASDQYSLAVTLYELLTGDPPFVGPGLSVQVLEAAPRPIAGVPAAVDETLRRALAKDPEDRFDSCTDLLVALCAAEAGMSEDELLQHAEAEPEPESEPPPARRASRGSSSGATGADNPALQTPRVTSAAIFADMARATGLGPAAAAAVIDGFWETIADAIRNQNAFTLAHFATFHRRQLAPRRNPFAPEDAPPPKPTSFWGSIFGSSSAPDPGHVPARAALRMRWLGHARGPDPLTLPATAPPAEARWVRQWGDRLQRQVAATGSVWDAPDISVRRRVAFRIHQKTGVALVDVATLLDRLIDTTRYLVEVRRADIHWARRGVFRVSRTAPHFIQNPLTGEGLQVPARTRAVFRPSPQYEAYALRQRDTCPAPVPA